MMVIGRKNGKETTSFEQIMDEMFRFEGTIPCSEKTLKYVSEHKEEVEEFLTNRLKMLLARRYGLI